MASAAFEIRALDYLLMPASVERIEKTISYREAVGAGGRSPVRQFDKNKMLRYLIKDGDKFYWIKLDDVYYFEGVG